MLVAIPILINGAFVLLGSIFGAKTAKTAVVIEVANREAGYKRGEGPLTPVVFTKIEPGEPGLGKDLWEICSLWVPQWVGKTLILTLSEAADVEALTRPAFAGVPPEEALTALIRYLDAFPKIRIR